MSNTNLLGFAFASLVLIALPGPDAALITRNALIGGQAAARRTMLGVSAALATAYTLLKLVGIVYLVYLGYGGSAG